jgi:hypothetical protein
MSTRDQSPKWWLLYLTFPLLIALFAVDNRLKIPGQGHQAVQIGILILVFGLVHLWLKANSTALSRMDQKKYHGMVSMIQIPPVRLPEPDEKKWPMFQLPNSEIKGMLNDTFDMNYIEAESFPIDHDLKN